MDSLRDCDQPSLPVRPLKKSGPQTRHGKQNSKQNALKHGIFSKVVLLRDEPQAELDSLLGGLRIDLEPEGELEDRLVDKLVIVAWRLRRLIIAFGERPLNLERMSPVDVVSITNYGAPTLELLLRYESSLERAFDRTLGQLERRQRIRKGEPVPPPLNVNVST